MTYAELLNTKLKILICDADERVLKRMKVWIQAMGEEVFSTVSGLKALEIYETNSIDIIILSDTINEIGTLELIDKIKAEHSDQVIVLIIKVFDSEIFKRSIELNVDKYLNAPVDAKILFNVLETLAKEKIWQQEFVRQKLLLEESVLNQKIDALRAQKSHNEEMNKMKDSFLTVFTHELKTPLNAILNFSDHVIKHLKKENFSKRDKLVNEMIEIKQGGISILDMINNVMSAIKLRDSTEPFDRSALYFNDIITQCINKFDYHLEEITLNINLPQESKIESDALHLTQMCENLLSNAIKYGQGVVDITLSVDDDRFNFEIEDNGEGIKDTSKAFELFEQSDENTMTRTSSGTGVGLFVIKEICDRLGYTIEILKSSTLGGAKISIKGLR